MEPMLEMLLTSRNICSKLRSTSQLFYYCGADELQCDAGYVARDVASVIFSFFSMLLL